MILKIIQRVKSKKEKVVREVLCLWVVGDFSAMLSTSGKKKTVESERLVFFTLHPKLLLVTELEGSPQV